MLKNKNSRRHFIKQTTFTILTAGSARSYAANEKLNIGIIGVFNRGKANLDGVKNENITALCDVDSNFLSTQSRNFPKANQYADFRRMIDSENLDALVVSSPDHTHAVATSFGLNNGLHTYCEKPLTHTISECRTITNLAREKNLVTQMGTQIHAGENYRRVVELLNSNAIGKVNEVHVWVASTFGGQPRTKGSYDAPNNLNYNLWLGPQKKYTPYHPTHHPFHWRQWWDFAGGTLADIGCHYIDLSHWALNLRHPSKIKVIDGPKPDNEYTPQSLVVDFHYKEIGKQPKTKLRWYHGKSRPPHFSEGILPNWGNGCLFIGNKGMLLADYNKHLLLPEKDFKDFQKPEPIIPKSIGHHQEWIEAIKTGSETTCNFDYSGPLTEVVLLGNIAHRTNTPIVWDHKKMKATGQSQADEFINHQYSKGWEL
ncbi:MAG: oxidoreductase [Verrucomicrobiales bacterium]|nr:oxidoreductase [Verrucomicrobiales bacterium]